MKILYLFDIDLDKESGVKNKICLQSKQWIENEHEVILLSLVSLSFFSIEGIRLTDSKIKRIGGKLGFLINRYKSSIKLKKLLQNLDFDIVYIRYIPYDPFFKHACQGKPIVSEMNTVYETETRQRSLVSYVYYMIFKKLSFNSINGFVCISNEINCNTLQKKYNSIVIANGINITDMQNENEIDVHSRPQITFIGSPDQKWHGVDKIIYLSSQLKNFDFHIIGKDGDDAENLFYHGYLSMNDANLLLKKSDVGIGSLAMHRLLMNEASPLKSRQYLAMGLPIIYAYDDTDLISDYEFALKLPNTESNVKDNVHTIQKFIKKVFQNNDIRTSAQDFAIKHLNSCEKEKKRLEFLESFL